MKVLPCELREANAFIEAYHRHHGRVQGHRFSLKAVDGDRLVGVCCVGRPVARLTDAATVAEVTRLCTDGTKNACSLLYAAAARAAQAMGFSKIQTFVLESEHGTSLKASGWTMDGTSPGGQWKHSDDAGRLWASRRTDQPTCAKTRWAKILTKGTQ